jgi:hypothetical protein
MQKNNIQTVPVYKIYSDLFKSERINLENYEGYSKYALELAGKDSIAASLKLIKDRKDERLIILPISILHSGFTGSLWDAPMVLSNFEYLKKLVTRKDVVLLNPIIYDCSKPFNELILRTMGIVQKKYSAFTPCVPCHLFLHLFRIPILKHFEISNLITGERIQHNNRIKLNQTPEILEFYQSKIKSLGINLIQPLKNLTENRSIDDLIVESKSDFDKLHNIEFKHEIIPDECIFSKNSEDDQGKPVFNSSQFLNQLQEFYYPKMYSFLDKDLNVD